MRIPAGRAAGASSKSLPPKSGVTNSLRNGSHSVHHQVESREPSTLGFGGQRESTESVHRAHLC
jgi:hypothetical protein